MSYCPGKIVILSVVCEHNMTKLMFDGGKTRIKLSNNGTTHCHIFLCRHRERPYNTFNFKSYDEVIN